MTVIRPNSVSGITSITAQANEINFFRSNGTLAGLNLNGVNFNTTAGISTLAALKVTGNVDVAGVLTYQDVTNVDSLGIGTFRTGINVSGGQLDVGSNIKLGNAGVITATSFVGSTLGLTGVFNSGGNVNCTSGRFQRGSSTVQDGDAIAGGININGTDMDASVIMSIFGNDGDFTRISGSKSRNASVGSHTIVQNNDVLLSLKGFGSDGTNFEEAAQIEMQVDGTPNNNVMPGRIVFKTTTTDGVAERLRIGSDGKVGVNTTAGAARLTVDAASGYSIIANGNSNAIALGSNGIILFGNKNAQAYGSGGYDATEHIFKTSGSEKLRITSAGHLLHGVTTDEDTSGSGGLRFINTGDIQIDGDQKALVFRSTNSTAQVQSGIEWWNENGAGVQAKILCDRTSVTYAPSDLVFYTNANVDTSANNSEGDITERLRIKSSGNVLVPAGKLGIGNRTSTPDENLHVHTASGQANIHVEGATDGQLILRAHNGDSKIHFGDASATTVGAITYDHGTDSLKLATNSSTRLNITSSGHVQTLANPSFRAGLNSNSSFNQNTDIVFNDTGATWHYNRGGHYNTSNGRFTAPVSGVYQFNACIIWYGAPNNTFMGDAFHFYVNGGNACYSGRRAFYNQGTTGQSLYYTDHMSVNLYLNSTDYVVIRQSAPVVTVHGNTYYTWFAGSFLG